MSPLYALLAAALLASSVSAAKKEISGAGPSGTDRAIQFLPHIPGQADGTPELLHQFPGKSKAEVELLVETVRKGEAEPEQRELLLKAYRAKGGPLPQWLEAAAPVKNPAAPVEAKPKPEAELPGSSFFPAIAALTEPGSPARRKIGEIRREVEGANNPAERRRIISKNAPEIEEIITSPPPPSMPEEKKEEWFNAGAQGADMFSRSATEERPEGFHRARRVSDSILNQRPNHRGALNSRAVARYGLGDHKGAVEDATTVIDHYEDDERAYTTRALAYYEMKNFSQAMEDAKRALSLNPNNKTAFQISKLAAGRITGAEELGLSAKQKRAADRIEREYKSMSQQRNQIEAAAKAAVNPSMFQAKAFVGSGDKMLDSLNHRAISRIRMNDPHAAIKLTTKVLGKSPENITALYTRAAAENLMGQYSNAVEDATAVLHRKPDHAQALDTRALALIELRRFRQALLDADRSLAIHPENAYAYRNRARAKEGLADYSGMIADYKLAARMNPQFEGDLTAVAKKYGIGVSISDAREAAAKPQRTRSRRFMVVLASSITGGLLIAFGLLHILMPARRKAAPGGAETQAAMAAGAGLGKSFKILRTIGNGGMGVVYEALDKALDRKVAIKKMRDEIRLNARERERFLQEARIVAALHHPNIVDIHSILEEEGELYMIFECVEGSTLDEIIRKKEKLSLREAIFIAQGICNALGYAHGKGVIHRDLKPANVMITKDGMVKVMDFGIARQAADAVLAATQTQTVAGTPQYMAPEQEEGKVSRESDIFALTACIYEMVTGERPFKGPNTTASKLGRNYPKPSRVTKGLPAGMDAFIDAGLEPVPERRIHSAAEFMTRFKEAASGLQAAS